MQTMLSQIPIFAGRARVITHLSGWLLLAFMFFYFLSGVRSMEEAFGRTGVNLSFMLAIFYGNTRFLVNRYLEIGRRSQYLAIVVLVLLGSAFLRSWIEVYWFGGSVFRMYTQGEDGAWRLFWGYFISFFLLWVFSTLYQLVENRHALAIQHLELGVRHQEAQLNYLKAQINPHFLFNTLHNIYAAASLQHPKTAEMVLRLSDLLRYVTYEAQAAQVPLEKELAQIYAYLDLFQLKSESPLPLKVEVLGVLQAWQIEPLLLLPLVENALKHGDLEMNSNAFLQISLHLSPEQLNFSVENSFDPSNAQKDAVGGVGLENVRHRLALHYASRHEFTASARENTFFASITLYAQ